jgi:hypothetical protein
MGAFTRKPYLVFGRDTYGSDHSTYHRYAEYPISGIFCYRIGYQEELLVNPFIQKDGFIEVPTSPGLSIELNPEVIRKFGVNVTKRWRLIAFLIKLVPNWAHDRA